MENVFDDIIKMFQAGAWLIVKILFEYFLLPVIAAMTIVGGVLRIRGPLFKLIMMTVTFLCFFLFVRYGLPQLTDEASKLTKFS